jgi:hypothetical protein
MKPLKPPVSFYSWVELDSTQNMTNDSYSNENYRGMSIWLLIYDECIKNTNTLSTAGAEFQLNKT